MGCFYLSTVISQWYLKETFPCFSAEMLFILLTALAFGSRHKPMQTSQKFHFLTYLCASWGITVVQMSWQLRARVYIFRVHEGKHPSPRFQTVLHYSAKIPTGSGKMCKTRFSLFHPRKEPETNHIILFQIKTFLCSSSEQSWEWDKNQPGDE